MYPPPTLTREQARTLDRRASEEFGLATLVLMENAGRGVADVLCALGIAGRVVIVCGKGNNGGDGFVIARHLDLRGFEVQVLLCCEARELEGDAAANYRVLALSGVPIQTLSDVPDSAALDLEFAAAEWLVDALLGTGARGEPRAPIGLVIERMNAAVAKRLAIDLPSGLDCDTGAPAKNTVRADHTCTFVAHKAGFLAPTAQPYLGIIHVLDIGAPRRLTQNLSSTNAADSIGRRSGRDSLR